MRTHYQTANDLQDWIKRQIEPVFWTYCPKTGAVPLNSWKPFVDVSHLPTGKKLLLRPNGPEGKGGVHATLPALQLSAGSGAAIDPLVLEQRRQLERERMEFMREREEFLTFRQETLAALQETGRIVDGRSRAFVDEIESRKASLIEQQQSFAELQRLCADALDRASKADAYTAISASVVYSIDRLANMAILAKIKNVKDIPEDVIKQFEGYLKWQATCRLADNLPQQEAKFVKDFLRFGPDGRKAILETIMAAMRQEAEDKRAKAQG